MTTLANGADDEFKGWWHVSVGAALTVQAAYNLMRFLATKRPRNAVNVMIYVPGAVWEFMQARYHFGKRPC